jgi:hypothetical protein
MTISSISLHAGRALPQPEDGHATSATELHPRWTRIVKKTATREHRHDLRDGILRPPTNGAYLMDTDEELPAPPASKRAIRTGDRD